MWQEIYGHDDVVERFRTSLAAGRLASTYLFVGPPGIGKRLFAQTLAQALLCQRLDSAPLNPCGTCESCRLLVAGNHPDLLLVSKPAGKSSIPVELFIGDDEHRMRAGLCHDIGLKPFLGGRRVAIIDDADDLNIEGANSLLKTLEEPPARSVLILIGTSAALQLPTIRSRCQIIRFQALKDDLLAEILVRTAAIDRQHALRLVPASQGSLERALQLADPAVEQFRSEFLTALSKPTVESLELSRSVTAIVDQAGREAPERRARLRQILSFAVEFYRHLLLTSSGAAPQADPVLHEAVRRRLSSSPADPETAADCLQRTLETLEHVDRNANQSTAIECWLDDLEQFTCAS